MKNDALELDSKAISALPIINKFIDRIGLSDLLSRYLPSKENQKLSHADAILLFVRNILIEREPLYKLSEWAALFDPYLVGLGETGASVLNDDRVGRSLDALFDADRAHFPQVRATISPPSCADIRAGRLTFNIEQTKRQAKKSHDLNLKVGEFRSESLNGLGGF
jgi:hypothetical protein